MKKLEELIFDQNNLVKYMNNSKTREERFFYKREIDVIEEHINNLRINEAKILLKNTTENITSIAMKLGFSDPNYFARIFKKQTGITPREYKR